VEFGKHRGCRVYELPEDYVEWMLSEPTSYHPQFRAICELHGQVYPRKRRRETFPEACEVDEDTRVEFGWHKSRRIGDIPDEYVDNLLDSDGPIHHPQVEQICRLYGKRFPFQEDIHTPSLGDFMALETLPRPLKEAAIKVAVERMACRAVPLRSAATETPPQGPSRARFTAPGRQPAKGAQRRSGCARAMSPRCGGGRPIGRRAMSPTAMCR
jgi:uncharacterized protein (DUF3820 family)